jgi:hypothetical protein
LLEAGSSQLSEEPLAFNKRPGCGVRLLAGGNNPGVHLKIKVMPDTDMDKM